MSDNALPPVHLLTCPVRARVCLQTLDHWARTDWPGPPRVHVDRAPFPVPIPWGSPARGHRLTEAFAQVLREALAEPGRDGDWLLLLEDDLEFHPQLARHVAAWGVLRDENCWLASLFNSGVRPRGLERPSSPRPSPPSDGGEGEEAKDDLPAHAFRAAPGSYLGSQALLLRRGAAAEALHQWDSLPGMQCQRLAKLFGHDRPLWVHRPSLVQHIATDSSWGARVKRAVDFDPAWEPQKGG